MKQQANCGFTQLLNSAVFFILILIESITLEIFQDAFETSNFTVLTCMIFSLASSSSFPSLLALPPALLHAASIVFFTAAAARSRSSRVGGGGGVAGRARKRGGTVGGGRAGDSLRTRKECEEGEEEVLTAGGGDGEGEGGMGTRGAAAGASTSRFSATSSSIRATCNQRCKSEYFFKQYVDFFAVT